MKTNLLHRPRVVAHTGDERVDLKLRRKPNVLPQPTQAIRILVGYFGGKLDKFFGFAAAQRTGQFHAPTPSRKDRRDAERDRRAMKMKPFQHGDGPRKRNSGYHEIPGKPAMQF